MPSTVGTTEDLVRADGGCFGIPYPSCPERRVFRPEKNIVEGSLVEESATEWRVAEAWLGNGMVPGD